MSSDVPKILLGITAFYVMAANHIDYMAVAAVVVIALLWWVTDR